MTNEYDRQKKRLELLKCPDCSGRGTVNDADIGDMDYRTWTCSACHGHGFRECPTCNGDQFLQPCEDCGSDQANAESHAIIARITGRTHQGASVREALRDLERLFWRASHTPLTADTEPPADLRVLFIEVFDEYRRALKKFPEPNTNWLALDEEKGELIKAILDRKYSDQATLQDIRKEFIQTMAMLLRLWFHGDQTIGLPPVYETSKL